MPIPPRARKDPKRIEQLGRVRIDDYAWLKDDNWQAVLRDPHLIRADIKAHLEAENAYTAAMMGGTQALQTALFEEMKGRVKQDDSSVPDPDGPWEYYVRYETGAQHPIHARRPSRQESGQENGEQILLDADALAKSSNKPFFKVGLADHSPDHKLYAYAVDDQGSEFWQIRVRDLATGADLPDPAQSSYGDFEWSPDGAYLFWVWRDENGRPAKLYRRPARGGSGDDVLVYEEEDDGFFLSIGAAESRAYILIRCGDHETNETWTIPASDPLAKPTLFAARDEGVQYEPTHWDGRWHILTNADGAVDFKVAVCAEGDTARGAWKDFIPHQPGRYIQGLLAYRDHLVRSERVNAVERIVVRARDGGEHSIAQEEEAYALFLEGGSAFDTTIMRYGYTSPTTPRQTFDYDMAARAKTLRKTQEIPSGHDPSRYIAKRLSAKAPDGEDVPITLLMAKDTPLDGSAPLLLYGYGSYGHPQEATFSIRALSLVNRGWVYALAHTRGGSDKGYGWFLDGRKAKKTNTFIDFIAVADHLIAEKYSSSGRIVAYGGSAGGMLMGAITNMRPDLWAGIIAAVPFVDVLNTMSDASLPLTPPEWPEWGNPLEDEAAYDQIASYSPYDKVEPKSYPAVLATGGLSDPRVTYWEPAKWIAKLRDNQQGDRPIMLKINMDAGHAGAAGRFDFLKEIALDYAFAIKAVGSSEAGGSF